MNPLEQAMADAETMPAIDRNQTKVVASERAEIALCAAALHLQGGVDEMRGLVRPDDLHAPARADLLRAAFAIADGGGAVDELTVAAELARRRVFDRFGGDEWLASFRSRVPRIDVVRTVATRVAELAQARRLIEQCQRVISDGLASLDEPKMFLERSLRRVQEVAESRTEGRVELMADTVDRSKKKWERAKAEGRVGGGIPTGYTALDVVTRGMRLKQTTFVGAHTGRGKSIYAMNVTTNVAGTVFNGDVMGVVFVSGENDEEQMHDRALCSLAEVDERTLERVMQDSPDLQHEAPLSWQEREALRERIETAQAKLARMPIAMFARSASVADVRSAVREAKRRFRELRPMPHWPEGVVPRVGLIVVDYVQMMKVRGNAERNELALGEYAYGIKDICNDENAHGLLPSQMRDPQRDRDGKSIEQSAEDMKGARALGESAGTSILVDRPAYGLPKNSKKRDILWPYTLFRITKGRNHGLGDVPMIFEGKFYRFRTPVGGEVDDMLARAREAGGKRYAPGSSLPGANDSQ